MAVAVYPWHQTQWRELLQRRAALPHALLFRGREGIGNSTSCAKLAQSLACESPAADGAACDACQSCRWFAASGHPDYRELQPEALRSAELLADETDATDPANPRPANANRAKRSGWKKSGICRISSNLTAHRRGGKTIVFYPAETLNPNAANALLKNLEEPPPGTRFMLIAHRPSYLPATIISRCQQVALQTPQVAAAGQWLREQGIANPELSLAQPAMRRSRRSRWMTGSSGPAQGIAGELGCGQGRCMTLAEQRARISCWPAAGLAATMDLRFTERKLGRQNTLQPGFRNRIDADFGWPASCRCRALSPGTGASAARRQPFAQCALVHRAVAVVVCGTAARESVTGGLCWLMQTAAAPWQNENTASHSSGHGQSPALWGGLCDSLNPCLSSSRYIVERVMPSRTAASDTLLADRSRASAIAWRSAAARAASRRITETSRCAPGSSRDPRR